MPATSAGLRSSLPPGKGGTGSAAKASSRAGVAADRVGEDLAGERRERHALAGIARRDIDARRGAAG